ncbi:MAG: IS630 family transposase [Alphaproteobacteria bacterium]
MFPKGKRTAVKVKLGFQNFYVYSAVNVNSGEDFSLIMPHVNTVNMNEFLIQLFKDLGDKQAILVMDGAGWHKSKGLVIPESIEIVYLPPYSPELNPVEKLWQYIKSYTIKNRIYGTIDQLEYVVCEFIRGLNPASIKQTCSSNHYAI